MGTWRSLRSCLLEGVALAGGTGTFASPIAVQRATKAKPRKTLKACTSRQPLFETSDEETIVKFGGCFGGSPDSLLLVISYGEENQLAHKHFSDGSCGTIVPGTDPQLIPGTHGTKGDFTVEFNRQRPVCRRDGSGLSQGRAPFVPITGSGLSQGRAPFVPITVRVCPEHHPAQNVYVYWFFSCPISGLVGHFRLPLPLPFFYRCFFRKGSFPGNRCAKTLINTVFCVQLSQNEFRHAYALLLHPASATKLTLEPPGRCPISPHLIFRKKLRKLPQW